MTGELFFFFFDVQHGHATYIKFPNGTHWFIDIGHGSIKDSNLTFSPLLHMRHKYNVTLLDNLVITHPHHDHIEDIFSLSELSVFVLTAPRHLTREDVLRGNQPSDIREVDEYLRLVNLYSSPVSEVYSPSGSTNNGGVWVRQFHPRNCNRNNLNNHSIVTVFSYAGFKVLIPGDNEAQSWRELLTDREFVTAITGTDILLAPHHGREAGYCEDIFDYFKPQLTIISDGPVTDTDAAAKYRNQTTGCKVKSRSTGVVSNRYILSTRYDKGIALGIVKEDSGSSYFYVTTE